MLKKRNEKTKKSEKKGHNIWAVSTSTRIVIIIIIIIIITIIITIIIIGNIVITPTTTNNNNIIFGNTLLPLYLRDLAFATSETATTTELSPQ